jgi:hypothetical protein
VYRFGSRSVCVCLEQDDGLLRLDRANQFDQFAPIHLARQPSTGPKWRAPKSQFLEWIQGDLGCPVPTLKYPLSENPKLWYRLHVPPRHKGRTRRHEREAGCNGRGWRRKTSDTNARTAKACGPGAPTLESSLR